MKFVTMLQMTIGESTRRACWTVAAVLLCLLSVTGADNDTPERRVAVVTLITTSVYIPGAQVLVESLKRVNATGDKILLWVSSEDDGRSDLTHDHMQDLTDAGWTKTIQLTEQDGTLTSCQVSESQQAMIETTPGLAGVARYWGTCNKFAMWTLTDYDAVIYLDADSLALNNFDFVYDYIQDDTVFAAQGNTDCWEEPPHNECKNFYTALMAIKPIENVAKYFHDLAQREGTYLVGGELELLNRVIARWNHLPRYTLVAQSEKARPLVDPGSPEVDWTQVNVYDFAGPPTTKPWKTYWLQKETGDKYANAHLERITPDMPAFHTYVHPQWVWNEYYDAVLERKRLKDIRDEL